MANGTGHGSSPSNHAYYAGRNSIGDDGEIYYTVEDRPEINTDELRFQFQLGVKHIRAELRLNADTEWDHD